MIIIPSMFGVQANSKGGTLSLVNFELDANLATTNINDSAQPLRKYRLYGGSVTNTFSKYGANCANTSSALTMTPNYTNDFNFQFNDFTLEFWFRPNSVNTGDFTIALFGNLDPTLRNFGQIGVTYRKPSGILTLNTCNGVGDGIFSTPSVSGAVSSSTSVWSHIALVRRNGIVNVYANGVSVITYSFNIALDFSVYPFSIGYHRLSNSAPSFAYYPTMYGAFDDFRVSDYAVYTQNFTPPGALT